MTVKGLTPNETPFAFLALLAASLPVGQYTADAGRWATAMSGLREDYGDTYPHLFRYFHFRFAPRADSYSPEVSNFLAFLQFADATVVHNPGFLRMEIHKDARKLLLDRYEKALSPEDVSAIKKMSQEIEGQLEVRQQI